MYSRAKEIISYLRPLVVETCVGRINPYLEIVKYKGNYQLNSRNANYSFGGLHGTFEKLFDKVNIKGFEFTNILLLGMGGGSIINLLREKYDVKAPITAIERDEVVINLAKRYFNIDQYQDLTIVCGDAYDYVLRTDQKFDLVISDVFIDSEVPMIFSSLEYLTNLKRIMTESSCIIFNKMTNERRYKNEFTHLSNNFTTVFQGAIVYRFYVNDSENSLLYWTNKPRLPKP